MNDAAVGRLRVPVPDAGNVSALLREPPEAAALLVLGHGAGAGMRHRFMEEIAAALAARRIATLRYQFPYMEAGRRAPDRAPRLVATVRAAVEAATGLAGTKDLPVFAGGKSMGGRMTSTAASEGPLGGVRGLVFFGFPLHPAGKPSTGRGDHLAGVGLPMLFLQGTRDRLAELDLLRPVLDGLDPGPTLHVVDDANHGFHVPKRTGRTDADVIEELADVSARWMAELAP
ncbi:MAG: alpha/beta family hydrolase [Gemmatimonadota bacterium]